MKKGLLFITLFSYVISQSQIVNIPDANFKNALLQHNPIINTNGDNEIQVTEAENYHGEIDMSWGQIGDFTGIESFINITSLKIFHQTSPTNITLDLSSNVQLNNLDCKFTKISNLIIENNTLLENLIISSSPIVNINIANCTSLVNLDCSFSSINYLDISQNVLLEKLNIADTPMSIINTTNNPNLLDLNCYEGNIDQLDLSNNLLLSFLNCQSNNITDLDLSNNLNLETLYCGVNPIPSLDLTNNNLLKILNCTQIHDDTFLPISIEDLTIEMSDLLNPDFSTLVNLKKINLSWSGQLQSLDLSANTELEEIDLNYCSYLEYINLKNGNNENLTPLYASDFYYLDSLTYVCIDDLNSDLAERIAQSNPDQSISFSEYCMQSQNNQIIGNIKLDLGDNGCGANNQAIPNLMVISDNGNETFATFTQQNGDFVLYTNEGDFITNVNNLSNYFTSTPDIQTNTFNGFYNTFTSNFCISPNQNFNDLNIFVMPISQARPGFNTSYKIIYKNVGRSILSGNIILNFDDAKLNFLNASEDVDIQTSNTLTFNYTNISPFETRTIDIEFNVFPPPTVNIDGILNFTAIINPIVNDFTEDDNTFFFNQTLIGSYDPNDISCLEGNEILLEETDKYLHYVIRFQNTGTASAINVVVKNILDNHLDWSTLQLESLSHNNRVAIKNGNEVEFIFENIDLPDITTDETSSHGFVAYKIKPKADIALDDIILNKAEIYFDYNSPIETNTAITRIVNTLALNNNTLLEFLLYPTPTENILNIKSNTKIVKIEIYSKLGQLILLNETENNINISNLTNGLYFVKVEDVNGNFGVKKIMKK